MTDAPRGDSADFDRLLREGAAEADAEHAATPQHDHAEADAGAHERGIDDLDALFGDVEVLDEQHAPRTGEHAVVDHGAPVPPPSPDSEPVSAAIPEVPPAPADPDAADQDASGPDASAPEASAPEASAPEASGPAFDAPRSAPAEEPFWLASDEPVDAATRVLPQLPQPGFEVPRAPAAPSADAATAASAPSADAATAASAPSASVAPADDAAPGADAWTAAGEAAKAGGRDWDVVDVPQHHEPTPSEAAAAVEPTVVEEPGANAAPAPPAPAGGDAAPSAPAAPDAVTPPVVTPPPSGWMLSTELPSAPAPDDAQGAPAPDDAQGASAPDAANGWTLSAANHAHGSAPGWDAIARTTQVPPLEVESLPADDDDDDDAVGVEPGNARVSLDPAGAAAAASAAASTPHLVPGATGAQPTGTVPPMPEPGPAPVAPETAGAPAPAPASASASESRAQRRASAKAEAAEAKAAERDAILHPTQPDTDDPLAQAAIHRVRTWLAREGDQPKRRDRSAERLAGLLADERGLDFAIGFVDRVVRPEDPVVSARAFDRLSRELPDFLDWYLKLGVTMGGGFGVLAPGAIIPIAKRAMRSLVSHLVLDATPDSLTKSFKRLRADGTRLNVNLLGEAVLGEQEAEHRLRGTIELLQRDDVDYVSIKVSSMAPQLQPWAFDETVASVVERLLPLYRIAATKQGESGPTPAFINLDMEEYRDLDLTIAVFQRILEQPELRGLHAGIVLQAYLPDALGALDRLTAWAQRRVDAGGAPIKVRVVKGANLAMERVDAAVHDWPLAVLPSKASTDANYKRVLTAALTPERTRAVRIGVAGHNLFDLAYAVELAQRTGTIGAIDVEMLLGMAAEHIDAIRADVPEVLLYTPVVRPKEFDAAVAYLVRRLEENGSGENFMSGMFELGRDLEVFERERDRFLASLDILRAEGMDAPLPNRRQDRGGDLAVAVGPVQEEGFENEPDTDPSLPANRDWARGVLERAAESQLGIRTLEMNRIEDVPTLERRIGKAVEASTAWAARGAEERARILRDAAVALGVYRGRLLEVMAVETGKTLAEGDPEVSEAIDFARYYADQAVLLEQTQDAKPVPVALTVVTPPWNFPVAIPCGGITAALATGSSVIVKPAPQARRSAAVLLEALWEAGVPRDVLVLCDMEEGEVSKHLIAHPAVGRLILTGSSETAALFSSWRADLPLLAETSGKNAIVVTPSADLDLAVADLVKSAFGHAGQKCSAASLGILVGSVATSERFRRQLVDAVQTLRVGSPLDPRTHVGPVIEPAQGKLLEALTTLGEGESWLVEPRRLDAEGRVWSPGVRVGVQPGSFTHVTEFFGPHLSLIAVRTLDDAIDVQNGTDYGLTAGIHSLDADEVGQWMHRVQAGNLYVNRGITGAIVRRQPFGGWRLSQVGPGAKAGGPSYLSTLVDWEPVFQPPRSNVKLAGLHARVSNLIEAATPQLDFLEFDRIRAGANSDQRAWESELGVSHDVSNLGVERNVLRHRPSQTLVRLADDGTLGQLMRVLAAAARARATVRLSLSQPLPPGVERLVTAHGPVLRVEEIVVESDAEFHDRLRSGAAVAPVAAAATDERGHDVHDGFVRSGEPTRRIRVCGTDAGLRPLLAGNPTIAVYDAPITVEGRLELMPFLREQAVSITAHRFGTPDEPFATLEV